MRLQVNQSSDTLRGLTRHSAGEKLVWQKNGFDMGTDLRQQARGTRLAGFADENRPKAKSAANAFLNDSEPLDSNLTGGGQLAVMEGLAQRLQERVVPAFNAPQAAAVDIFGILQSQLLMTDHTRYSARHAYSCYLNSRKYNGSGE